MSPMKGKPEKTVLRRILKGVGICFAVILLLVVGLVIVLSVTEYKPKDREEISISGMPSRTLHTDEAFSILSWNNGYGALGDNADFFMDGGSHVYTADKDRVQENMKTIQQVIKEVAPNILFIQEADLRSDRSYSINEYEALASQFGQFTSAFAYNFNVLFLPYPLPPIGHVESGLGLFSSYAAEEAYRIQLPVPFSWPMRMANLKRALLVERIPVEDSSKELVLVDLHLEAYDDGEGKTAQTKMLRELLQQEFEKGNYVIAGGDFNQIFSSANDGTYAVKEGLWAPGEIDIADFTGDWQFLMDTSVPSCRSLDQPYEGADRDSFQYYVIDGFIVSSNVEVLSFQTLDQGFIASDHIPVYLEVKLK